MNTLILCSHGTANLLGQQTISRLHHMVRDARPDLDVTLAHVDVQQPDVANAVQDAASSAMSVVVVPLLLATGFHVQVDIAQAVAPFEHATSAAPLGPDPVLTQILYDRLLAAGWQPGDGVVLAAAGSSRADAREAPEQAARELAAQLGQPVTVGYGASAEPTVAEAVRAARLAHARVVVAAYLLAPGHFHDRLADAGADLVTEPIGADPRLVELILRRYEATP